MFIILVKEFEIQKLVIKVRALTIFRTCIATLNVLNLFILYRKFTYIFFFLLLTSCTRTLEYIERKSCKEGVSLNPTFDFYIINVPYTYLLYGNFSYRRRQCGVSSPLTWSTPLKSTNNTGYANPRHTWIYTSRSNGCIRITLKMCLPTRVQFLNIQRGLSHSLCNGLTKTMTFRWNIYMVPLTEIKKTGYIYFLCFTSYSH